MESLTLTLFMSIVHGLSETDSFQLNYWYLMVFILRNFHALSLLHFQTPRCAPAFSTPAFSTPAFSGFQRPQKFLHSLVFSPVKYVFGFETQLNIVAMLFLSGECACEHLRFVNYAECSHSAF